MKRPDKWDKLAKLLMDRIIWLQGEFVTEYARPRQERKLAAVMRRTDAAAEKRGYAKAVADRKARVSEAFAKEEERRRGMEP